MKCGITENIPQISDKKKKAIDIYFIKVLF